MSRFDPADPADAEPRAVDLLRTDHVNSVARTGLDFPGVPLPTTSVAG